MRYTWNAEDIIKATKGAVVCGKDRVFSEISIDSRKTGPNDIFVAIKGAVHDGHDFTGQVVEKGCQGIIIEEHRLSSMPLKQWESKKVLCIKVKDTIKALGDLASYNLDRSNASVIAITGSNGKTTTRALTHAAISPYFDVLATKGNYNNEIGLPLTLFRLSSSHKWAVLELGMNHKGEIRRLAKICKPNIGVITNIGPAHLEGLGSMEAIKNAKGELIEELNPKGTAVLNADDFRVMDLATKFSGNILLFGFSQKAMIRAEFVKETKNGNFFTLVTPFGKAEIKLAGAGKFMVINALAAAGAGHILGLGPDKIKKGLESFTPVRGRMNIFETKEGIHVIDDTYNANPESMRAALDIFQKLRGSAKGIFVAGDMLELGDYSEKLHRSIGEEAVKKGVDRIFIFGDFASSVADGAIYMGMDSKKIFCGTKKEISEHLSSILKTGDWVLIKGSRGMAMEDVVNKLSDRK